MAIILKRYCPKCQAETQRKADLIEGQVVHRCKTCRVYYLDGDHVACADVQQLEARAEAMQRWNEVRSSDISDPRWTRI